jgi:methionine synthase II (cobalamin-independent)
VSVKIKGKDYLLPVSGVGSWPRPTWLKGRVFGTVTEPDYTSFAVREQFEDATRLCVDDQERLGFDVITDGQQYYEAGTPYDYEVGFHHLPTRIAGTVPYGPPIAAFLTKVNQITVVDDLKWVRPIFGPAMEVVSRYTTKPRKLNLFTPAVLANVALHDRHYGDHEKLCYAIADVYNAEFKDLVARDLVDIIQFSDAVPDYVSTPYITDVINRATDGVDAQIWVHACQGNAGDRFLLEGSAELMFPDVYKIRMDLLHLALAHQLRAPDLELLRRYAPPAGVCLGAGVVDVKDPTPEKVDVVVERIDSVLKVMDPSRVVLMPDCGWMNRRRDTVWDKNSVLVEAAKHVRERYR